MFEALDLALALVDGHVLWDELDDNAKRLMTQAIFERLVPTPDDNVIAERTVLYEEIARLNADLASGGHETARQIREAWASAANGQDSAPRPEKDHDPDFRGHGSYFDQMAGASGFEPATSRV